MTFFDFLQFAGGLILTGGYVPQIIQIIRTKSASDLNLTTFISLTLGISMMEAYAVNLFITTGEAMFLITNTMALMVNITMLALVIKYGEKKAKQTSLQMAYKTKTFKKRR